MTLCAIQTRHPLGHTLPNLPYWSSQMTRRTGLRSGLRPTCLPYLAMVYLMRTDSTTSGRVQHCIRSEAVCPQTCGLWSTNSNRFTKILLSHQMLSKALLTVLAILGLSRKVSMAFDLMAWMGLLWLLVLTPLALVIPPLWFLAWMFLRRSVTCWMSPMLRG